MNDYAELLHIITEQNIDVNDVKSLELLVKTLNFSSKCGIIYSVEELQSEIINMQNKKYLDSHSYEIWQGNDGRWKTHLPDTTQKSGRKLIAKSTREKIEQEIINFYKSLEEAATAKKLTLRSFYQTWLDYKKLQTRAAMYIRRIGSDWDNYYLNDSIIDKPLKDLNFDTLQEWALRKVREKELTKKQYYNMTVIIRQSLDYAVQKKLIDENPFQKVHIESKLFKVKRKPSNKKEVFLTDEQPLIESEAFRDFEETGFTACLAIPLAFQTGLRLGEIVALKETDIQGNYIRVQRMEVREVEQLPDGSWSTQKFKIVDYTKSEAGERDVFLTSKAKDIIKKIIECNRNNGYNDHDFLFQNKNGRIYSKSVDCRIRKYCRHIGISEKATHKVRKTYISALIDSGLNIDKIRELAGHEDERTTYGNYCFNRMTDTQTENLLENALV